MKQTSTLSRRRLIKAAASIGASWAWCGYAAGSRVQWRERRDLYPEGVASGDPAANSVILWTRHPLDSKLTVEVAEDQEFRKVVAASPAVISADSDWTCRVLVGGLKPAHEYWYRFTDESGNGSRVGRTITAPASDDSRRFNSRSSVVRMPIKARRRLIAE